MKNFNISHRVLEIQLSTIKIGSCYLTFFFSVYKSHFVYYIVYLNWRIKLNINIAMINATCIITFKEIKISS